MVGPRLADAWSRAGAPPRPAAADAPLDPTWQRAFERAEPPGARDVVRDAAEREPAFSYRTASEVLNRLPEPAAALLRRLDDAATEARDRTISLSRHLDDARDRAGRVSLDVRAAIRAAGLPEVQTADQARTMAALGKWPAGYGERERSHVARIVAEGQRLAEAEAEVARLREQLRDHNERAAPITALRHRLAEAAGRMRPPIRALALPEVSAAKAERTLAEARREIETVRSEIERIEAAPLHPDDAPQAAREAVQALAARTSPHRFVKTAQGTITLREPHPAHHADDDPPVSPLALVASIAPEAVTTWVLSATPTDPDAPRLADRPRLLAEARQRLRDAELAERAAIRALGEPLDMFRPDADPAVTLMVEGGR
jgi:hypothetical protein